MKTKIFIEKAINIHGGTYDYSKVIYTNNKQKVIITCPIHGNFNIRPNDHLNRKGCSKCGNIERIKKLTKSTEQFIIDANLKHNNFYDYSKVKYENSKQKVIITCPTHGDFNMKPNSHLDGQNCPKCSKQIFDLKSFIIRGNNIHNNKYDYSKAIYNGTHNKVDIVCPIHGDFTINIKEHIHQKQGCWKCGNTKRTISRTKNLETFLDEANTKYNNKYDYTLIDEYVNNHVDVNIICPTHGIFSQTPKEHLNKHRKGCPKCNMSIGETKIYNYLVKNNIESVYEHKFKDNCISKYEYDFYLPYYNLCIEFDGEQHFKPIDWFGGLKSLIKIINRDHIKDRYCHVNNINMLRIPYYEIENVETIIENYLLNI